MSLENGLVLARERRAVANASVGRDQRRLLVLIRFMVSAFSCFRIRELLTTVDLHP